MKDAICCSECRANGTDCEHCRGTGREPCRACMCNPKRAATHVDPASGDPICDVCSYEGPCAVCLDPQTTIAGIAYGDKPACEPCLAMARSQARAGALVGRAA